MNINTTDMNHSIEPYCFTVLPPAEMVKLGALVLAEVKENQMPLADWELLTEKMTSFNLRWQAVFARFEKQTAGELSYRDLLLELEEQTTASVKPWLKGGSGEQALRTILSPLQTGSVPPPQFNRESLLRERKKAARRLLAGFTPPVFKRPVFLISAPRSGSTLLFESLARFPQLWTVNEESHELIEGIPELHPATHDYTSNRLTAADATPAVIALLRDRFARQLQDATKRDYMDLPTEMRPGEVRFLEKTPKNALRIPFLRAVFPDACFVVLYRKPEETISSMLEGWRSRRFVAYQPLPGWPHRAWKFLLTPGWETLPHRPLVDIVAHQWCVTYQTIFADLQPLPASSWHLVHYADLVHKPQQTLQKIADFAELNWDKPTAQMFGQDLPLSSMTFSAPTGEKWLRNALELQTVLPGLQSVVRQMAALNEDLTGF
jgi:hypothetical protein